MSLQFPLVSQFPYFLHQAIASAFGRTPSAVDDFSFIATKPEQGQHDGILLYRSWKFVVYFRQQFDKMAIHFFDSSDFQAYIDDGYILLCIVPFMNDAAQRRYHDYCQSKELPNTHTTRFCWLDLCGNAYLDYHLQTNHSQKNLHIHVINRENIFLQKGRNRDLFSTKKSRIARWFLQNPHEQIRQRELAQILSLDEGFVSKSIREYIDQNYLDKNENKQLFLINPQSLLEDWEHAYHFSDHQRIVGQISSRSTEISQQRLLMFLQQHNIKYAFTGLAGAWFVSPHAQYKTISLYVDPMIPHHVLSELGYFFDDDKKPLSAGNIWILQPDDPWILDQSRLMTEQNIFYMHPIQIYLDLGAHPERAKEAKLQIRQSIDDTFSKLSKH